ncbi:MAG: trypsin-like peptidase domain-containing protein, partial [Clostridia bacterium]|nr:trypsin-like peptidase domain-containing protein [Clostridia bacterium]
GWDKDFSAPTEEMTVSPIWKKIHTVTFVLDGGQAVDEALLTQKIVDGEGAVAPEISREGYVFDAWDTDFSAITGDMTVTAKWKKLHTVTFDLLGGTSEDTELLVQTIVDGESATLPTATKDRFNLVKWDADVSSVTGDMTVKAVWERKVFTSKEIFDLINPGTVEIKTYRMNDQYYSLGSGFFIDEDGLLLTNYHVIEESRSYKVTLSDGTVYDVSEVVAYDIDKDIALLQVDTQGNKVPYLEIAPELPAVGDFVYALGSSLGLTGTFSNGIVSYVNRTVKDIPNVNFIQTTTPISSGNSGGPLVNDKGYVIGINSASYTEGQNLNLAIEISQYRGIEEASLTPEELFQKEGKIRWYFGELIVQETGESKTGQLLENGSTVHGTINDSKSDYYMVEALEEESYMILMIKADSEEGLEDIAEGYTARYAKYDISRGSVVLPPIYYTGSIVEGEDGEMYFLAVIMLDEPYVSSCKYFGVGLRAQQKVEYEMYIYILTEDMLESFM